MNEFRQIAFVCQNLACLLAFMKFMTGSNRFDDTSPRALILSFNSCFWVMILFLADVFWKVSKHFQDMLSSIYQALNRPLLFPY